MAQVAFAAVAPGLLGLTAGTAAAANAAAVAGMIGAVADSQLLLPMLLRSSTPRGANIDDAPTSLGSEGTPIPLVYGEIRTGGVIFWRSKFRTRTGRTTGGTRVDLAMMIAANPLSDPVRKVWASGRVLYEVDNDVLLTGLDDIDVAVFPGSLPPYHGDIMQISKSDGSIDFSVFTAGFKLTTTGFEAALNNGTFPIRGAGPTLVGLYNPNAVPVVDDDGITLHEMVPDIDKGTMREVTTYDGSQTTPDPLMEKRLGVGNVPVYRGWSFVVIRGLRITPWGMIPQMNVLARESEAPTRASVIADICNRWGLGGRYDVSGVSGTLDGYRVDGSVRGLEALGPILIAYDIVAQDRNGKLWFYDRPAADTINLDTGEFPAARDRDDFADRPHRQRNRGALEPATELNVTFVDKNNDYEKGNVRAFVQQAPYRKVMTLDLQLALSATEASRIAKKLLWYSWLTNTERLTLPPSRIQIAENDKLVFEAHNRTYEILARRVDRDTNFLIEVEGADMAEHVLDIVGTADDKMLDGEGSIDLGDYLAVLPIDVAPLRDTELDVAALYFGFSTFNDSTFARANLWESRDGANFNDVEAINHAAILGRVQTTLPNASPLYWDLVSTVDVELIGDATLELVSRTDDEVYNRKNWALIGGPDTGWEVIGFGVAELQSGRTYRLSRLLRGLRGTEEATGLHDHTNGEFFCLLDPESLLVRELAMGDLGSHLYYKAVPVGADEADYDASEVEEFAAGTIRPFAPCNLSITRDASNNATIRWTRRTRALINLVVDGIAPMVDLESPGSPWGVSHADDGVFEVDVYYGGDLVDTRRVEGRDFYLYTASQQSDDGITPGDEFTIQVYPIGIAGQRGKVAEYTG